MNYVVPALEDILSGKVRTEVLKSLANSPKQRIYRLVRKLKINTGNVKNAVAQLTEWNILNVKIIREKEKIVWAKSPQAEALRFSREISLTTLIWKKFQTR